MVSRPYALFLAKSTLNYTMVCAHGICKIQLEKG